MHCPALCTSALTLSTLWLRKVSDDDSEPWSTEASAVSTGGSEVGAREVRVA